MPNGRGEIYRAWKDQFRKMSDEGDIHLTDEQITKLAERALADMIRFPATAEEREAMRREPIFWTCERCDIRIYGDEPCPNCKTTHRMQLKRGGG